MNWEDIIKIGYIPSDARKRSAPTINWLDAFDKFVAKVKVIGPIGDIQLALTPVEDLSLLLSSRLSS